ncbi:IS3 family transposase [Peptoniphilus sp. MSJ-1]|uniref:IS3 family transposase n=1 Tax=Peptoniphilus ovalis TaxID=2841503 RepID=A0ABS6FEU0_9FIRM|nr:IS3 family transposase [Peptoniphilus ovalis]
MPKSGESISKKVKSLNSGKKPKNREKTIIIEELRQENKDIKLKIWLTVAKIGKSSYYEWKKKLENPDKKEKEATEKIAKIVEESKGRYGYRRVTLILKKEGHPMNHKKVLRIMRENNLLCTKFHKKNRKYSSYRGTVGKIAENELKRQFKVEKPNQVYVSDVTEFKVKGEEKKYIYHQ